MIKRDKNMGVLLTKNITYSLHINQEQLDLLTELVGFVGGSGRTRDIINELYEELSQYSTRDSDICETTFFKDDSLIVVK